ncbi:TnsA-like heteromeric transposase endonuclease subunit [Streptomyces sp. NPDC001774]
MDSTGWGCLVEAEDFRLEYVDAAGDLHEGALEVMWPARFKAAGQVRTFSSYRGQRSFPGWYWAATCAELAGYESWVELGPLIRLDSDPGVVAMASQPFRISWRSGDRARRTSHTPDYFVRRRDGTGVVLDVRPDDRIEPEDAVKFEVTAAACARVGWGFERVGVLDLVAAANLRWLSGYRHPRVRREPVVAELRTAFARPRVWGRGSVQRVIRSPCSRCSSICSGAGSWRWIWRPVCCRRPRRDARCPWPRGRWEGMPARPRLLSLGYRVRYDGREHTVAALHGTSVRLVDDAQAASVVLLGHLLVSEGFTVLSTALSRPPLPEAGGLEGLPEEAAQRAEWWRRHLVCGSGSWPSCPNCGAAVRRWS